ncbi:MAG: MATE family efflux transporter [Methanobacteriaceae archaeon]|jgi:putative MATE family efflux protein|nr:MATE family efflux transporter [Candidatus Methanorudis spinitermitis]
MIDIDRDKKKFHQDLNNNSEKNNEVTDGVSTILGDPKKAILKFQPLIIAMIIAALNNIIDIMWISGLGPNALAAVGFITPLLGIITGLSSGLSSGAVSVLSRFIGANNKKEADNAALHILFVTIIFTVIIMITVGLFLEPILIMLGAGSTVDLGLHYGYIIFGGAIFPMFTTAAHGILRAEGNINKTIYAMAIAALLNMILDPIFIYTLNMGIAGGSLGTILSLVVATMVILYWFRGDTYIDLSLKNFKYNPDTIKKILTVSLPAGSEYFIIALSVGVINMILVTVSGTHGVAIFTVGWNFILLAIIILAPLSISTIATVGSSLGAKKYENFNIIQNFSTKLGILIAIIMAIATFLLAPYIAVIFTYSSEATGLSGPITEFLRLMAVFFLFVPIGSVATSMFLGVGKGLESFILITLRQFLLSVVLAYVLAIPLGFGQQGVWCGIIFGNIIGSLIALLWSKLYIKKIIATNKEEHNPIKS